jgi:hypothetical protein
MADLFQPMPGKSTSIAATAPTANMAIPAGVVEMFRKGAADTVAAICGAGGTATVYLTPGVGE